MKIAFVVNSFPKLSETFILNQIKGLIDSGHEVTVFARREPEEEIEHELVDEYNLKERTIYFEPPTSYSGVLRNTPVQLLNLLKREKKPIETLKLLRYGRFAPQKINALEKFVGEEFDILHFHFGTRAKEFIHFQKFTDAKIVTSFYGYDASQAPKESGFDGYNSVFTDSDTVTALSQDMTSKLEKLGCGSEKIREAPLCIDTSKFEPRETENEVPKILTVARFTEKKGIKYAVKALSQIEQDFEYHLVGDGELREKIEKQVEENGLEDQVFFHGWMTNEEVKEKMQESDIFLLPSVTASNGDEEGTPTVLLEAQATGLPVVSTWHAGIPEIVEDRETALLSEEKDFEKLSENLMRLIDDVELRKEYGKAGRDYIEQDHSIEEISQKLEDIYQS
jgi:colanic acid/amylovoran biosynthesis glycosyltransferase